MSPPAEPTTQPTLGLGDIVSLLLGIVVGTAVFKVPAVVFGNVTAPWEAFALWLLGGLLSLAGAFCYAELAACYPRSGGDYEYLSRAFGRSVGLQFAWAQLLVVLTGSIGSMACIFADYVEDLCGLSAAAGTALALGVIVVLTLVNLAGVVVGARAQNVLTAAKVLGVAAILAAGMIGGNLAAVQSAPVEGGRDAGIALVLILYAYAGWSHAAYVAAETRDPQRTLPRALVAGVACVTALYLALNLAYLAVLGFAGVRSASAPAAATMTAVLGPAGGHAVGVIVILSTLGAINGTLLTGAHVFAVLGEDYPRLTWLRARGGSQGRLTGPLLIEGAISGLLVLAVGTAFGRAAIDRTLLSLSLPAAPWEKYYGGFDTLIAATAPLYWVFCLLTGLSLFVLRLRDPARPRPFRTPAYPLLPMLFCAACAYMLYRSLDYAGGLAVLGLLPVVTGGLITWLHRREPQRRAPNDG